MLRISLLGEQTVTDVETGTVRTRSSRTVALVAYLAVHAGMPQSRQRIAGLFWPDSTQMQSLTNLRRELHNLRQILGNEPSLVVTSADLSWQDTETCRVDVRAFVLERAAALAAAAEKDSTGVLAHAAAAIADYRGDLLPGSYDDWVIDVRSEFERHCVELCDLLADVRMRTGDLPGAVQVARRRIQLQPLEEIGYRTLMRLQADLRDRAGAVSTYHHCASVLERELGIDPDDATRQTLQQLLAREHPAPRPVLGQSTGRSGLFGGKLVGRAAEFGLLQARWQACAAGRPGIAVVRGEAGAGKTRLVAEIADLARLQGAVVAGTQCFGISGRLALAPVADWLRSRDVRSVTAMLDPVWRAEVDRLVPSAGDPSTGVAVEAWQRHRFFEGMARALIAVDRPMLLVLDNLQWCDQETLAFLTLYLGLAADRPVMLAATLRKDDADEEPGLGNWLARMRDTGMLTELALGPLELSETARLAEAIVGQPLDDHETQLLQAMTGGFPLYVVEAARTTVDLGRSPGPADDLTAVLRSRLEQVPPAVQEIAGLAAAVGRDFTLDLLAEASDLAADTVARAVDELWRRRIVREFRDGYDFSHDLLRDAAYAQVSPPRRWLLHRRLAQALELLHADNDAISAQLAEQYSRGGRPERAIAAYRRAATVAAGRFAHVEAIRLHRAALSIVQTLPAGRDRDRQELDVLEAIAAPLNARSGYSSPELQEALGRCITLAELLGRRDSALAGLIGLWTSLFVQGNLAGAEQAVTRALRLVESAPELSGPAHFAYGGMALSLGRPVEALPHFELAATLSPGTAILTVGTRADVHARAWAAHAHWLLGHDDEALSCSREAIELARTIDHPYSLAVALAYGAITHQMRHNVSALRDCVAELRELCDRYQFAYYREWGLILDGWSRKDSDGDTVGVDLVQEGIAKLKSQGAFARMPYWLSLLAELSQQHNRTGTAPAILDAALVDGQSRLDVWWIPEVMRMRAAYDEPESAVVRLRSAARLAREHGSAALLRRCERDLAGRTLRERRNS